jgi:monoamine oxidase
MTSCRFVQTYYACLSICDDVNIGVMMITRRSILASSSAALIAGIAPRNLWAITEADVVVIGAGLAGLIAAHRLELAGLKVVILEGERRVGGRLHTLDDLPGQPDAGGIQVGSGYRQLRGIADELGVTLIEGSGAGAGAAESRSALFRINGQTVTVADWPTSPTNRLNDAERATLPLALAQLYGAKLPRFAKSEDWMTADPALDISYADALAKSAASAEALRLIEANLNGNMLAGMSQIHIMRAAAIFREGAGPTATIKGGSQRLPEAMAAALKSGIRLDQRVRAISHDADGVTVSLTGGKRIRARFAICTIPFAALRNVPINGGLDPAIIMMIQRLPYTRASFAYISATEAFWKNDGYPAMLWTDDPALGRVFVLG